MKRKQALLGSNLPRDNRTKEVSFDTGLEDHCNLRGFFFFVKIPSNLRFDKALI